FASERGTGTLRVNFASGNAKQTWELRSAQQFVCRTPCARWINPTESYELRTENGPDFQTIEVPDLSPYVGSSNLEVRAHARDQGAFVGGIVTAGVGGGLAFMGGFLALMGGLSERDGLLVAGGVTAGIGVVAIVPGVYLIATSGSEAEVRSDRDAGAGRRLLGAPGLGVAGSL